MVSKRVVVVSALSFALGIGFLACSDDSNRPPVASSGGIVVGTSGGVGGSSGSGSSSGDGSAPVDGSTSSSGGSSGGSSGTSGTDAAFIQTGFRATIDAVNFEYESVKAERAGQTTGSVIVVSGLDAAVNGNKLTVTITAGNGLVAAGAYNCNGGVANTNQSSVKYEIAGGETMNAVATGDCTVVINTIDNSLTGLAEGTFTARVRGASATKTITKGEFRVQF